MPIRPPYLENGTSAAQIAGIISGMEIPISSIKGAVTSVNGFHGDVKITPDMVDAQPKSALLSEISSMSSLGDSGMLSFSSGHFHMSPVSDFVKNLFQSPNDLNFRGRLGLGSSSVLDVNVPHGIPQLDDNGKLPSNLISLNLASVATSGSYNDLKDKPTMAGQINADWNATEGSAFILNKPTIPTVKYPVTSVNQKTGDIVLAASDVGAAATLHKHAIADVAGLQTALDGKRSNAPISYTDLQNIPSIPKDTLDLTNGAGFITSSSLPSVPVSSVNNKIGDVVLSASDVGAATQQHNHAITDITGLRTELDSKRSNTPVLYSEIQGVPAIPKDTVDLTNTAGFITASAIPSAPVKTVNSKTGDVVLTPSDVGAAPANHNHAITGVTGLQDALDAKVSRSESIPYTRITGTPTIPAAQVQSDWTQSVSTSADYIKNKPTLFDGNYASLANKPVLFDGTWTSLSGKPTIPAAQVQSDWNQTNAASADFIKNKPAIPSVVYPVTSVNSKTGAVVLTNTDVGAAATSHAHAISDVTGLQTALNGKIPTGASIAYSTLTGAPVIPTDTNQLTNNAGFVTGTQAAAAAPVQSVNGKTGAVVLSPGDIGAATAASGTKYIRTAGTVASGVKVKYYTVTSDANGAWTLALGTDFTEVLDVQAQAVSTAGITGVRQSTVNTFTSTSTTITGMTWGNTALVTILLSGTNSLSLTPNTVVRVRVEGVGP